MERKYLELNSRLDVSKFKVGPLKPNKGAGGSGGKGHSASLTYDGSPFNLALLNITLPFGASPYKDEATGSEKWSLDCELPEDQLNKINEFDEFIIDLCHKHDGIMNNQEISGKSREFCESKYKRMLKYAKDKVTKKPKTEFAPKFRVKMYTDASGEFTAEFYRSRYTKNAQGVEVQLKPETVNVTTKAPADDSRLITNFLPRQARGSLLCRLSVFATALGFGVTASLYQVKVEFKETVKPGVCQIPGDYLGEGGCEEEDDCSGGKAQDPIMDGASEKLESDTELADNVLEEEPAIEPDPVVEPEPEPVAVLAPAVAVESAAAVATEPVSKPARRGVRAKV